jgi:2-iminobutanoate/2-iminopropanoate deaminase
MYVSGQASVDPDWRHHPRQLRGRDATFDRQPQGHLEAGGLSLDRHVINVRSYLADEADGALYNRIYPEKFSASPAPARSTIGVLGTRLKFRPVRRHRHLTRQQAT